jgi:cysteine desulfurase
MTVYLDCNATTPIDPRVQAAMVACATTTFGNAGSPHEFGAQAKEAVHRARDQIGSVVAARRHEVIFTSGATESNNLALLGLAPHGQDSGKRHIVSTRIEHASVLEPLEALAERGFEVTLVPPTSGGWVEPRAIRAAVRPDTLLVSVMQVNNETGVRQPLAKIARLLDDTDLYLHVDAAQGFGKEIEPLRDARIDLISVTAHKIYGPQGIGALILRRRNFELPPLAPLGRGGGQELGLRSGTLPVPLIVGFGLAAELALQETDERAEACRRFRQQLLEGLAPLRPVLHSQPEQTLPHTLNLSFPGISADAVIDAWQGLAAVSNGSACTSACATASHVLSAMQLPAAQADGAIRLSWCHRTEQPPWAQLVAAIERQQRAEISSPSEP